jgi:hypothetical protein
VTPDRITIDDRDDRAFGKPDGMVHRFYIDRNLGVLSEFLWMPGPVNFWRERDATCTVAPFSGMPAAKF